MVKKEALPVRAAGKVADLASRELARYQSTGRGLMRTPMMVDFAN